MLLVGGRIVSGPRQHSLSRFGVPSDRKAISLLPNVRVFSSAVLLRREGMGDYRWTRPFYWGGIPLELDTLTQKARKYRESRERMLCSSLLLQCILPILLVLKISMFHSMYGF
jgi:hypothetical protein